MQLVLKRLVDDLPGGVVVRLPALVLAGQAPQVKYLDAFLVAVDFERGETTVGRHRACGGDLQADVEGVATELPGNSQHQRAGLLRKRDESADVLFVRGLEAQEPANVKTGLR